MLAFVAPGPVQFLIFGAIILLLFGNRIPGAMRSLGSSIVEFKKGVKDDSNDDDSNDNEDRDNRNS
jgi:sec-independent protein translocase protein TatA